MTDDAETFAAMLETVLAPVPEARRKVMVMWAQREMMTRPIVTFCTARLWTNAYTFKDQTTGLERKVDAGWFTMEWAVGKQSPQNPAATIFAMIADEGPSAQGPQSKVVVYSFASVKVEGSDEVAISYFKETVYRPDTTYGPTTPEGIYRDWFDFMADEEEQAIAAQALEHARGRGGSDAENGAAS